MLRLLQARAVKPVHKLRAQMPFLGLSLPLLTVALAGVLMYRWWSARPSPVVRHWSGGN